MFVAVVGGWPGSLISLLTFALPVQEVFLPARYHKYFKPSRYCVSPWRQSIEFEGPKTYHGAAIYVVLGRPNFLRHVLAAIDGCKWLIVTVDIKRCGVSRPLLSQAGADGLQLLQDFDLCPLNVGDAATGGVTDACHLLFCE